MKNYRFYFFFLFFIVLILTPLAGCSSNEAVSKEILAETENEKTVITIEELSAAEFKKQHELKKFNTLFILDIRYPEDYNKNHLEGSVNILFSEVPDRLDEIPKDKEILIICYLGKTAVGVGEDLKKLGYNPIVLSGGFKAIEEAGLETIVNE